MQHRYIGSRSHRSKRRTGSTSDAARSAPIIRRVHRSSLLQALVLAVLTVGCEPTAQEYLDAADRGDLSVIERGLGKSPDGDTEALRHAIEGGHEALIVRLTQPDSKARADEALTALKVWLSWRRIDATPTLTKTGVMALLARDPSVLPHLLALVVWRGDAALLGQLLEDPSVQSHLSQLPPEERGDTLRSAALITSEGKPGLRYVPLERGDKAMMTALLDAGAAPHTFLVETLFRGDVEMLSLILDHGGSGAKGLHFLLASDQYPQAFVDRTIERRAELVRILIDHGARIDDMLLLAVTTAEVETLRVVLDTVGGDVESALAAARQGGDSALIGVLEGATKEPEGAAP